MSLSKPVASDKRLVRLTQVNFLEWTGNFLTSVKSLTHNPWPPPRALPRACGGVCS